MSRRRNRRRRAVNGNGNGLSAWIQGNQTLVATIVFLVGIGIGIERMNSSVRQVRQTSIHHSETLSSSIESLRVSVDKLSSKLDRESEEREEEIEGLTSQIVNLKTNQVIIWSELSDLIGEIHGISPTETLDQKHREGNVVPPAGPRDDYRR